MGFDIKPMICSVLAVFLAPFRVDRPLNVSGIERMIH